MQLKLVENPSLLKSPIKPNVTIEPIFEIL